MAPRYELHRYMEEQLKKSLEGTEVTIFLIGVDEEPDQLHKQYFEVARQGTLLVVLNKMDLCSTEALTASKERWFNFFGGCDLLCVSAQSKEGLDLLIDQLLRHMPAHPPLLFG